MAKPKYFRYVEDTLTERDKRRAQPITIVDLPESGGGGDNAVTSVNGKTGAVVLGVDDVAGAVSDTQLETNLEDYVREDEVVDIIENNVPVRFFGSATGLWAGTQAELDALTPQEGVIYIVTEE